jgi:AcrR family transcriptional regulator
VPTRSAGTPARERELRTQGRRTMSRLLDAGMDVLAERGYHAARVDDVVRRARTSHGTFYLYFANKEDLFRALAVECAGEMKALAAGLGPVTPDDAGRAAVREWLAGFLATYRRYGAVIRAWMEDQAGDRNLTGVGIDAFADITRSLVHRVEQAAPAHVDRPELAAGAMVAMVERFVYYVTSRGLPVDDDSVLDVLAGLVHRGFFGAPAARR